MESLWYCQLSSLIHVGVLRSDHWWFFYDRKVFLIELLKIMFWLRCESYVDSLVCLWFHLQARKDWNIISRLGNVIVNRLTRFAIKYYTNGKCVRCSLFTLWFELQRRLSTSGKFFRLAKKNKNCQERNKGRTVQINLHAGIEWSEWSGGPRDENGSHTPSHSGQLRPSPPGGDCGQKWGDPFVPRSINEYGRCVREIW